MRAHVCIVYSIYKIFYVLSLLDYNCVVYICVALSSEAVWDRVRGMTPEQARHFGLNLNLDQNMIDRIVHAEESGGSQALRMFIEWKRNCDLSDESAITNLNGAIENSKVYGKQTAHKGLPSRQAEHTNGMY